MVSHPVKINLSALKYEIKASLYHKNPPASQLEALANFHGFKNQDDYPDFQRTIQVLSDYVGVLSSDPGQKAYGNLLKADLAACKKKGEAVLTSGAPVTFLRQYGSMKSTCFLFLERGSTRSAYTIVEYTGDTDYFCDYLGPGRLERGCPLLCPLLVHNNRQTYELLEVKEESQERFVQLITAALTPSNGSTDTTDHVFVSADETLVDMMPAVEEAINNSLHQDRKKWFPVK